VNVVGEESIVQGKGTQRSAKRVFPIDRSFSMSAAEVNVRI
jgi:hypothetical protein